MRCARRASAPGTRLQLLRPSSVEEAAATWDHIAHSPNCSIAKASRLLGYQPRYTSLEAVQESVAWLIEHQVVTV